MSEERSLKEDLGLQFEMYKKFFDMSLEANLFKACPYSTNLRLPTGISNKLDGIRNYYKKHYFVNISKNDIIVIALAIMFNMSQGKNKDFQSNRDYQGIEYFFAEFHNELKFAVQNHLMEQQYKKMKGK